MNKVDQRAKSTGLDEKVQQDFEATKRRIEELSKRREGDATRRGILKKLGLSPDSDK